MNNENNFNSNRSEKEIRNEDRYNKLIEEKLHIDKEFQIKLEKLYQQKKEQDEMYRERFSALEDERMELERKYEEKLRQEKLDKESILRLKNERDAEVRDCQERADGIKEEMKRQERWYDDKIACLKDSESEMKEDMRAKIEQGQVFQNRIKELHEEINLGKDNYRRKLDDINKVYQNQHGMESSEPGYKEREAIFQRKIKELEMEKRNQEALYYDKLDELEKAKEYFLDFLDEKKEYSRSIKAFDDKLESLRAEKEQFESDFRKKIAEVQDFRQQVEESRENKKMIIENAKEYKERLYMLEQEKHNYDSYYEERLREIQNEIDDRSRQFEMKEKSFEDNNAMDVIKERHQEMEKDFLSKMKGLQEEKEELDQKFRKALNKMQEQKLKNEQAYINKEGEQERNTDAKKQEGESGFTSEKEEKEKLSPEEGGPVNPMPVFHDRVEKRKTNVLNRLNELEDYTVEDEDPDIRGWDVYTNTGECIGKIDDLIVDTEAMQVRYLELDVDHDILGKTEDVHMLIPIGIASINTNEDNITIKNVEKETLMHMPEYHGEPVTREYEHSVIKSISANKEYPSQKKLGTEWDNTFYNQEHFDTNKFWGRDAD